MIQIEEQRSHQRDNHAGAWPINILTFGAMGDGVTKCTESIQAAINDCAAGGGGTVFIPAGTYLTGAIHLRSNINLHLEGGATLLFSNDVDDFPSVFTRWAGVECAAAYSPCLYGKDLSNISLTGRGTLDGQGAWWWKRRKQLAESATFQPNAREQEFKRRNIDLTWEECPNKEWQLQYLRPPLVQFVNCQHVFLQGVTLQNSPFWNTHLVYCDDVTVHGVTFLNPQNAPNADGLDIDSSKNIRVSDCHFDVNDDCLCLKAGMDRDGRRVNKPTENVTITNCTMLRGHGGVVFGSDISGSIRNVCISNCIFNGTGRGLRFKANRARGGTVENVMASNLLMIGTECPFVINSFYGCAHDLSDMEIFGEDSKSVTEKTPTFRNISVQGLVARGVAGAAVCIVGLPESRVTGLVFDNVEIETLTGPDLVPVRVDAFGNKTPDYWLWSGEGFRATFVTNMILRNVRIHPRQGPALRIDNASEVTVEGFDSRLQLKKEEVIVFHDVTALHFQSHRFGREERNVRDSPGLEPE